MIKAGSVLEGGKESEKGGGVKERSGGDVGQKKKLRGRREVCGVYDENSSRLRVNGGKLARAAPLGKDAPFNSSPSKQGGWDAKLAVIKIRSRRTVVKSG